MKQNEIEASRFTALILFSFGNIEADEVNNSTTLQKA